MKVFLQIFMLIFCSCNLHVQSGRNIKITNGQLSAIIKDFIAHYSEIKDDGKKTVSISISIKKNDTVIGLYADKQLKPEFYIGCITGKKEDLYFYAE